MIVSVYDIITVTVSSFNIMVSSDVIITSSIVGILAYVFMTLNCTPVRIVIVPLIK